MNSFKRFFLWIMTLLQPLIDNKRAESVLGKVIGLLLLIVALPIFAAMGILSAAASAGLISMQTTIVDFMPLFGVGAAFAFLAGFGMVRGGTLA